MAIHDFFDKTFMVRRMKVVSGNKKAYVSTMTIEGHMQDQGDSNDQEYFGAYTAAYKAWIDPYVTIREGDKIRTSDGLNYEVMKVNKKEYSFAENVHQELILKLLDPNDINT
jgi:hypothetical protein